MIKHRPQFLTAAEAAEYIHTGDTITVEGFAWGFCFPEEIALALETRFLKTGAPGDLTLFFGAGPGDKVERGFNHFGHEGLLKTVIGSHFALNPMLQQIIAEEKVDAYNMPLGVIAQSFRELAAGKPFIVSKIGLHTCIDPRYGGGRLNNKADHDISELVNIHGEEYLLYRVPKIDVAIIRGTYSDEHGNIAFDKEVVALTANSIAQACHNNGGTVIVQVEKVVKAGSIHPKSVQLPGICADIIVEASDKKYQMMNFHNQYDPSFTGEIRESAQDSSLPAMNPVTRRIAERGFRELREGMIVNLGIGYPEFVAAIAREKGFIDKITFTVECGIVGGAVQNGCNFACSRNPECLMDMAYMFDFYHGGGLDITYLGFAEIDRDGNVNVSRIGNFVPGVGGFIDISQNTKQVVFCGTMLTKSGKKKFKNHVEQISFNGRQTVENGGRVLYITEVGVFRMTLQGMELIEVFPGVDVEQDILRHMEFVPTIHIGQTTEER